MEFWILWFIGWGIVLVTRIAINCFCRDSSDVYSINKIVRIIINLLIIISIVIVGGIIVAKFICIFATMDISSLTTWEKIFIFVFLIIGALITYLVGFIILGLYHLDEYCSLQLFFIVVFILSIIGWSIPIWHYNQNFETNTQTIVESKEERQLLYFCNIPVQEVSGNISGSSYLGTGNVLGEITTSNNLSYWYLNQNNEGIFDSVSATVSKISFINDKQFPHVEIIVYSTKSTIKNLNNGTEKTITDKTWAEYTFYVPSTIMQYNLN